MAEEDFVTTIPALDRLSSGRFETPTILKALLPKWSSAEIPVFAVYSNRKFLPSRLSVFLNALAAWRSPLWIKD
jgi:hypothetical protein